MSEQHFNGLSPAQHERLSWLIEEMAEAIQIGGKILRHGYESYNPVNNQGTNQTMLAEELGDVFAAYDMMVEAFDISPEEVEMARGEKRESVREWLHHQPSPKKAVGER